MKKRLCFFALVIFFLVLLIRPIYSYDFSDRLNMTDRVLVLYNVNANDSREIAEYYANARGINHSHLCNVSLPTGQFATGDQLMGARKTIVENCICSLIPSEIRPSPCNSSNISEIAKVSNITHLAIIRGIPPRLTGTGWSQDNEEPSLDFYLAYMIYREENLSFPGISYLYFNYSGSVDDSIDFQSSNTVDGFPRALNASLDQMMAYGRIEAMNKTRTFELIDRTIEAENQGVRGNFLVGLNTDSTFDYFRTLTSSLGSECDYNSTKDSWDYTACRVGASNGQIPGESGSTMSYIPNATIMINNYYTNNGHSAFDGFTNMLNWRVGNSSCIPLCRNTADVEGCMMNSTDYFREINTDCVGVADGFLGWQLRSWPVQYYGFWPYGWTHYSGGNGAYEKTPPRVLIGDSFKNEIFTDDNYLRFGQDDAIENPQCVLENGTVSSCKEQIGVNLINSNSVTSSGWVVDSERNFTLKFRHRNPANSGTAKVYVYLHASTNESGYASFKSTSVDLSSEHSDWTEAEISGSVDKDGEKITALSISFVSYLSSAPKGWLELDGVELIDDETGTQIISTTAGSFNGSFEQTTSGDWAANVIDRLGGIAWWGSSSHFLTGGFAFYSSDRVITALYGGRTLGESLLLGWNQMSGIVYGDPLYRPSGARLYVNGGLIPLGSQNSGYVFNGTNRGEKEMINLSINAFHGKNNIGSTKWNITWCNNTNLTWCDSTGVWEEVVSGIGAVFSHQEEINLSEYISNFSGYNNIVFKLNVYNEGEESEDLTNYAYFSYGSCVDLDGDGYGEYCEGGPDCDDGNLSIWHNWQGYVDADADGFGIGDLITICGGASLPLGYSSIGGDCNDTNLSIWRNLTVYVDSDKDGYGIGNPIEMCSPNGPLSEYSLIDGDCADNNIFRSPSLLEICDAYDNNCDGIINEGAVCCGNGQCDGVSDSSCPSECPSTPSSGGGGGGGGGGGTIDTSENRTIEMNGTNEKIHKIEFEEKEIEKIYTLEIKGQNHSIKVLEFNEEKIVLEIRSEPMIVEILNGETKKIDINGDEKEDIKIKYGGISEGKSLLEVKIIEESKFLNILTGGVGAVLIIFLIIVIGIVFHIIKIKRNKSAVICFGKKALVKSSNYKY